MAYKTIDFIIRADTDSAYRTIASILKNDSSYKEAEYYPDQRGIRIASKGSMDDMVRLAKTMADQLDQKETGREFVMEGYACSSNSGEELGCRIEKKKDKLTIQETETYQFFGALFFEDYSDFLETALRICEDAEEACPEDEFDPDLEYYITDDKIYADEPPEYGESQEIIRDGTVKRQEEYRPFERDDEFGL